MISVEEAKQIISKHNLRFSKSSVTIANSLGCVLAEPIYSPIDHPLFDQSAVDGYAFRLNDWSHKSSLKLVGETAAGSESYKGLAKGEAIRILTGAPVYSDADTVVMQEYTQVTGDELSIEEHNFKIGSNIRKKGEQLKSGDKVLEAGHRLNASSIGLLCSLGIEEVMVEELSVGIVVTGNEFADGPDDIREGLIYESNGPMLSAAIESLGLKSKLYRARDTMEEMLDSIQLASDENELILITGGVSVGDYDFTLPALERLGFKKCFHKIAQKPGKPLLFAENKGQLAFGLPGNPRSVMSCFYVYVRSLLSSTEYRIIHLPLGHDHSKKNDGKTHFVSAKVIEYEIHLQKGQASHMLQSLATSDVLVCLPSNIHSFNTGDMLEVVWL